MAATDHEDGPPNAEVLDALFEGVSLVESQIASFDQFVEESLPRIFADMDRVNIHTQFIPTVPPNVRHHLRLRDMRIYKPTVCEVDGRN